MWFDVFLSGEDIQNIKLGKSIKKFIGEHIIDIKKQNNDNFKED